MYVLIRRAFISMAATAILEPNGLPRDNDKSPDEMTLVPWKMGQLLTWNAICVYTMAPSHLPITISRAGSAAASAEDSKRRKYGTLGKNYTFLPFGVEILGPWDPSGKDFFRDLRSSLTLLITGGLAPFLASKLALPYSVDYIINNFRI